MDNFKWSILVVVIFCVYLTDTRNLPVSSNFVTILVSSVGAVSWLLFLQKKHFKILPKAVYYVYIPIGFILLSQIINMDTSLAYESKISQLLLGYVIVSSVSFKSFFDHYLRIMTVVAIVSTVVWVTTFLGITWWSFLPTTWENNYYSYLIGVIHTNPLLQHRNFGPFWEPGVYQIYLNIAILYLLFFRSGEMKCSLMWLIAALVTTFSTTGYICFSIILCALLWKESVVANRRIIPLIMVMTILGVILLSNEYVSEVVFGKFEDGGGVSFLIRIYAIEFYGKVILENPYFGLGVEKSMKTVNDMYNSVGLNFSDSACTTTMREFACMGGIFGFYRLYIQWKFSRLFTQKIHVSFLIFLMIIICLNTEDVIYSVFFNVIFYYGIFYLSEANAKNIV